MDLSTITYQDRTLDILHPSTGEKTGVTVTLMSLQDPRLAEFKANLRTIQLRNQRQNKENPIEQQSADLLFKCMVDWNWGKADFQGSKPEFNRGNVDKVFETLPWFKAQIEGAIEDERGFFHS